MFRATLLAAFMIGAAAMATAQEYDVFVLCGQSNMDGRGAVKDLPKDLAGPQEKIKLFFENPPFTSGGWVALAPGYSAPPGYKGELPSKAFGPEIGFGSHIAKAMPDRAIAILKVTKGGTSLAKDWTPGKKGEAKGQGPMFQSLVKALKESLPALTKNGDSFKIKGMAWHQGEADAASTTEVYKTQLTEFIARVREELNEPNVPFVVGEVFDNGKRDTVRAAQLEVSRTVPNVGFASAKGLETYDKGTHFDAASQLQLGERLATEMLAQLKRKPGEKPK